MISIIYYWGPIFIVIIFSLNQFFSWRFISIELIRPGIFVSSSQILFFVTLFIVRGRILLFTFYYFSSGADYIRFIGILFAFLISIVFLILHKGSLILFLGWDGLGVTSYLLVIYYLNFKRTSGGITTVITNRLGDVFLFIFLLSSSLMRTPIEIFSLFTGFLVICAFTKRAQAPFSSWLPMAIRAPTPVSSLVHRSTLVTAGLYLLIKYSSFWTLSSFLSILMGAGVSTMFIARFIALSEKDFKKIIALRTLSQLGFIITGLGLGCLTLSFFHLITHAFFKSCIFVQVGGIILINNTSQDGRGYSLSGNNRISIILIIRCLRLCGFPFLRGFFSKDLILVGIISPTIKFIFIFFLLLGVFITFLYSLRIIIFSQLRTNRIQNKIILRVNFYSSGFILISLGILSGAILFSSLFLPPLSLLFFEKLTPIFYWVLVFLIPYRFIKYTEQRGGIFIQDSLVLTPQKIVLSTFKAGENLQFSIINNLYFKFLSLSFISSRILSIPSLVLIRLLFLIIIFSLGVKHIFLPKRRQ